MYCPKCGKVNEDGCSVCVACGEAITSEPSISASADQLTQQPTSETTDSPKSKVTAGLLGIFLGALGIHNFYLGFTKRGIIQLVVSLVGSPLFGIGPIAMGIWGFVEGIMYLTGSKNTDANGNSLK